jgi:NitT/TauT family transport system substrate-binding protein
MLPMNRAALLIALIATTIFVNGCDSKNSSSTTTAPAQVAAVTEVRLGYFPNLTHGQALLGVSSGDFANAVAPATFKDVQFNAGPNLIEALFARQIDIGYVGPGPVISAWARSHGKDIRVISGAAANGVVIVARKDSGIHTLADLVGKKIATPQHGNTQDIAARHYVTGVLKQPDTTNVLGIPNADQAGMMLRGDIDASWAPEPWGSILVDRAGGQVIGEEKDLWPGKEFSLTVIVTTPDFLSAHPDVVAKILAVHQQWTDRLASDPSKYLPQLQDALKAKTGKALPDNIAAAALGRVKFTTVALPDTFESNAQWSVDLGFTKEKPDLTGLIDLSILKGLPASR